MWRLQRPDERRSRGVGHDPDFAADMIEQPCFDLTQISSKLHLFDTLISFEHIQIVESIFDTKKRPSQKKTIKR